LAFFSEGTHNLAVLTLCSVSK